MSAAVVAGFAVSYAAVFAAGAYVYYRVGVKAVAAVVKEYEAAEAFAKASYSNSVSEIRSAHSTVVVKLDAVKAEVAKLESEGKAEEAAAVARIKKLL